jgi:hypothetical protein
MTMLGCQWHAIIESGDTRAAIYLVRKDLIAACEKFHGGEGASHPSVGYPMHSICKPADAVSRAASLHTTCTLRG